MSAIRSYAWTPERVAQAEHNIATWDIGVIADWYIEMPPPLGEV